MIFQHTHEWITGVSPHTGLTKTQTRRLVKPGEEPGMFFPPFAVVAPRGDRFRDVYSVDCTYAVQPGRGKHSVARIRITDIRREDVRDISAADAIAEGFGTPFAFLQTWVKMHDKDVERYPPVAWMSGDADAAIEYLRTRPDERYQAWVLTFERVGGAT